MAVREILKMGDPRLLRVAQPVKAFDTPELHALSADWNYAGVARPAPACACHSSGAVLYINRVPDRHRRKGPARTRPAMRK